MTYKNKNLEQLILAGWTPTMDGEFLDLYNKRTMGGVSSTILTGICYRNMHYVVETRNQILNKERMIAKIYPDGHPDLQGKKDPKHPVRYFDIRKLTPTECYRLMGVPPRFIEKLMATEKRAYTAFVGLDKELELFGLEPSATMKEVMDAYEEAMRDYETQRQRAQRFIDEGFQDPKTRPATDEDGEEIFYGYESEEEYDLYVRKCQDELEANELYRRNHTLAYNALRGGKQSRSMAMCRLSATAIITSWLATPLFAMCLGIFMRNLCTPQVAVFQVK